MRIREATQQDWKATWAILEPVLREGETWTLPPGWSEEEARAYWFRAGHFTYVALEDAGEAALGAYYMRANQLGFGDHVANAGFLVAEPARGRGVGRALGEHALQEARRLGFAAMQFNGVVKTNPASWGLWLSLGFEIVGTLTNAYRSPRYGLTDIYVMYREL